MSVFAHLKEDGAEWWRRFWNQPNQAYRNFQIAFFLLGVHFLIPSFIYAFNPQGAIGTPDAWFTYRWLGKLLGADSYPFAEDGFVWRVLGAGNVFTLAFMCFLIELNVRRFYPVLIPLCVLKAYSSIGFLIVYFFGYKYPAFFAVFLWDGINVLMFLYFAHTAYWSLSEWGEESAVPRLYFKQGQTGLTG